MRGFWRPNTALRYPGSRISANWICDRKYVLMGYKLENWCGFGGKYREEEGRRKKKFEFYAFAVELWRHKCCGRPQSGRAQSRRMPDELWVVWAAAASCSCRPTRCEMEPHVG